MGAPRKRAGAIPAFTPNLDASGNGIKRYAYKDGSPVCFTGPGDALVAAGVVLREWLTDGTERYRGQVKRSVRVEYQGMDIRTRLSQKGRTYDVWIYLPKAEASDEVSSREIALALIGEYGYEGAQRRIQAVKELPPDELREGLHELERVRYIRERAIIGPGYGYDGNAPVTWAECDWQPKPELARKLATYTPVHIEELYKACKKYGGGARG